MQVAIMTRYTLLFACIGLHPSRTTDRNILSLTFEILSDVLEHLRLEHGQNIARPSQTNGKDKQKTKAKDRNAEDDDYESEENTTWQCRECCYTILSKRKNYPTFNSSEEIWWHLQQRHVGALRRIRVHRI